MGNLDKMARTKAVCDLDEGLWSCLFNIHSCCGRVHYRLLCVCKPVLSPLNVKDCLRTSYKRVVSSVLRCGRCRRVSSGSPGLWRGAPVSAVWAVGAGTSGCPRSDRVAAGRGRRHRWGSRRRSFQSGESLAKSVLVTSEQIHIDNWHCYTVVQEQHRRHQGTVRDVHKTPDYMYCQWFPWGETNDR